MEKKHITARLDSDLAKRIHDMAKNDHRSFSNMIERLLESAMTKKEVEEKEVE